MVNATNETNVSQKEISTTSKRAGIELSLEESVKHSFHFPKNAEQRFLEATRNINRECYDEADIKFVLKEGRMNLRTIYGIYLSMCNEEGVEKVITWRTFYMQCNGYRTMKPNTMRAVAKFVTMKSKVVKAVIANDTITL